MPWHHPQSLFSRTQLFPEISRSSVQELRFWKSEPGQNPAKATTESNNKLARLEAVLLIAHEPLHSRKLAQLASLSDGTEARTLTRQLNEQYHDRQAAFRVEHVAGGYQLLTRPQYNPWLRRLHQQHQELRLSIPALETLAIVAYRQPVLRAQIEAIRGVLCGEILRQLMERDLVRIAGKSDELGRPFLYGTTKQFLQLFGLKDLDQLPRADVLRGSVSSEEETNLSSAPKEEEVKANVLPNEKVAEHPEDDEAHKLIRAVDDDDDDLDDEDDDWDDADDDDDDDDFDDDDDEFEDDDWEEVDDEDEDFDDDEEDWDDDDDDWDDDDDDDDWDEDDDADDGSDE